MFIIEGSRNAAAADHGASPWVLVGDRLSKPYKGLEYGAHAHTLMHFLEGLLVQQEKTQTQAPFVKMKDMGLRETMCRGF